jgi:acyl-CoA synthetase (NDP forming)
MKRGQIIERIRREGRTHLTEIEAKEVLKEAGLPVVETRLARDKKEAITLSKEIGFPVVLKIVARAIIHKSDAGGVKLGLQNVTQVGRAYSEMLSSVNRNYPNAGIEGISVQKMAPPGVEVIIGVTRDPQFGPMVMFGLGGVYVEALRDVSFRIAPLTRQDAEEMVQEPRSSRILAGLRGTPPADTAAIVDCLLRVSQLMVDLPEVEELDINPLVVWELGSGAVAVDARVVLAPMP